LILGAIEITSRVTRLSVLDISGDTAMRLTGRSHGVRAELENLERLTALLMAEVEYARDAGADLIEVFACPEMRGTRLVRLLDRTSRAVGAGPVRIPADRDSVGAAFLAATLPERNPGKQAIGVALVGEAMIGLGVGEPGTAPGWVGTRPAGAVTMTERARFSDPPRPNQIEAAITGASRRLESFGPPPMDRLLAVSDHSTVIERLCGNRITHDDARRGLDSILGQTSDDLAAWFGIEPASSRFLPGTIVGHAAIADAFGLPVEPVGCEIAAGRHWLESDRQAAGKGPS